MIYISFINFAIDINIFKYKYERRPISRGGYWCLMIILSIFLLMRIARRKFVGLETQSLHERGINSHI